MGFGAPTLEIVKFAATVALMRPTNSFHVARHSNDEMLRNPLDFGKSSYDTKPF